MTASCWLFCAWDSISSFGRYNRCKFLLVCLVSFISFASYHHLLLLSPDLHHDYHHDHHLPLVLALGRIMKSPRSYGPFSASHASHSSENSFISHGEMAPNCCPPGKLIIFKLWNDKVPMPLSYLEISLSMGTAAIKSKTMVWSLGVTDSIMANWPASVPKSGLLAKTYQKYIYNKNEQYIYGSNQQGRAKGVSRRHQTPMKIVTKHVYVHFLPILHPWQIHTLPLDWVPCRVVRPR